MAENKQSEEKEEQVKEAGSKKPDTTEEKKVQGTKEKEMGQSKDQGKDKPETSAQSKSQASRDIPRSAPQAQLDEDDEDDLEPLIKEFIESKDAIQSMLVMFRKLKQAGIVDFIDKLSEDYMPSDVEFIGKFLSSREFTYSILKSANTLLGLMYALSRESTSDTIKALLFDSEGVVDAMVTGAKNPERMSMMRLFAMTKDPEIASGLTVVLNMLKEIGKTLQKVKND